MKSIFFKKIKYFHEYITHPYRLISGFTIKLQNKTSVRIPKPIHKCLILKSIQLAELAGYDQAIQFAEKYNNGMYTNTLNILKANRDINDTPTWLKHINAYFKSFDMSPLELQETSGTRFQKLYSRATNNIGSQNVLVSVIITAYNAEDTIRHSIKSIQKQSWSNLEIIIIDDNSNDNTWNIISNIMHSDNRVRAYKNNVNVGPYVSKNIALRIISGKYFTCHDSDDWSHPDRIYKQVINMEQDSADASIILMLRAKHSMEVTRFHRINKSCIDGAARYSLISCMFKTDYFRKKLGSWDTVRINADSELRERVNINLGEKFKRYQILGLVCLDNENSLTNHPEFGTGLTDMQNSPRKIYSLAYRKWHKSITKDSVYLAFPQSQRKFNAPKAIKSNHEDIQKLVSFYKSNYNFDF